MIQSLAKRVSHFTSKEEQEIMDRQMKEIWKAAEKPGKKRATLGNATKKGKTSKNVGAPKKEKKRSAPPKTSKKGSVSRKKPTSGNASKKARPAIKEKRDRSKEEASKAFGEWTSALKKQYEAVDQAKLKSNVFVPFNDPVFRIQIAIREFKKAKKEYMNLCEEKNYFGAYHYARAQYHLLMAH
jgi:hypothetical protein